MAQLHEEAAQWKQRALDAQAAYNMEAGRSASAVMERDESRRALFYSELELEVVEDDAYELTKVIKKVRHQRDAMVKEQHSSLTLLGRTLEPARQPSKVVLKQTKVEAVEKFKALKAARNQHIHMLYEGPGYGGQMPRNEGR